MRRIILVVLALAVSFLLLSSSFAAEHGGATLHKEHGGQTHEHGGKEHAGTKTKEPQAKDIRKAMAGYVTLQSRQTGTFTVLDRKTGKTRKLKLIRIHKRVGKTGEYYYSCADFKDTETKETVDVDLDVEHKDGKLNVVDVRIHKVNGKERYTYDQNDNRIPLN